MRFYWVDTAKTLLIFLVVLGHLHYIYAPVPGKDLIYAFHVPAFLFITGFLVPPDFGQIGLGRVLSKWILTYLRAYAFFSAIAITLWWVLLSAKSGEIANPLPALLGAFYGVGGSSNGLVHGNPPLWYFPFLTTSVLGGWVCAQLGRLGWVVAIAYALFALLYQGVRLPWALDISGIGTLVFLSGHALRRNYDFVRPMLERPWAALALGTTMCAGLLILSHVNCSTNLNGREFGQSGLMYLLATYCGITLVISFCAMVPHTRMAKLISTDTMTIFALHFYLLRLFSKLAPAAPASPIGALAVAVLISLLTIFGCMALARLLRPVLETILMRNQVSVAQSRL